MNKKLWKRGLERGRRRRQEDSRGEREEGRFEREEFGGGGG
jgi:hypothetical protein